MRAGRDPHDGSPSNCLCRRLLLGAGRQKSSEASCSAASAPHGNAATRIQSLTTRDGIYAVGVIPEVEALFQRQAVAIVIQRRVAT
jgi:hypothetical protein